MSVSFADFYVKERSSNINGHFFQIFLFSFQTKYSGCNMKLGLDGKCEKKKRNIEKNMFTVFVLIISVLILSFVFVGQPKHYLFSQAFLYSISARWQRLFTHFSFVPMQATHFTFIFHAWTFRHATEKKNMIKNNDVAQSPRHDSK